MYDYSKKPKVVRNAKKEENKPNTEEEKKEAKKAAMKLKLSLIHI